MKKTFKVIMLPTEKASRICILASNKLNYGAEALASNNTTLQHLYIISDDEIKEGDWFIDIDNIPYQAKTPMLSIIANSKLCSKIVATTDKSLNGKSDSGLQMCLCGTWQIGKDGYPGCKGNCHTLDIPESFIQAYIKAYNEGKPITEVDLEMTKTIKESRPGVYEINLPIIEVIKTRTDNTVIISEVKEYRKREMEKCIESPYYFYTQYCIINGERAQSILNEKEFNELWKRFRKI